MLAFKNLLRNKLRTLLNITGVTLAVVSLIVLTSLGIGLLDTGEKVLEASSMHLWISGQPVDLSTRYTQSSQAKITEAHQIGNSIQADPRVSMSTPLLTEIIYAYKKGQQPRALFGLGVATGGSMVKVTAGTPISTSTLYNGGTYNGSFSTEVLLDSRAVNYLDAKVGDTIFVGKTLSDAREFNVVGISDSLSTFSTNPTIIFPLPEFQLITGNHYYDSVSLIIVRLNDINTAEDVKQDLQQQYPEYRISTNKDFLDNMIKQNSFLIGSAFSIVILAIIMSTSLVIVTMLLSLNERKKEIGVLLTIGFSRFSIAKIFGFEGFIISVAGGVFGILLSFPIAELITQITRTITGFELILVIDNTILLLGFSIALIIGLLSTLTTIWHLSTMEPMEQIRSI